MSVTLTNEKSTERTYYYAVNIQGDVTAILNTSGTAVVEYTYDAWGNVLSITGSKAPARKSADPEGESPPGDLRKRKNTNP